MLHFVSKALVRCRMGYSVTAQNPSMGLSSSLRFFSTDANSQSFTVSYLINRCGLSPESASLASKKVQFKTSQKPDLILSFFKKHGISEAEISEMIRKEPTLLKHKLETISPRVEFLRSKGASTHDLIRILAVNPWILRCSLNKRLIPNFSFLVKHFESEPMAIRAIKRSPHCLTYSLESSYLLPNIIALRDNGVTAANIAYFFSWNLQAMIRFSPVKFRETVEEVKEMGFDPSKKSFVQAITILTSMTRSTRDKKVEVFKSWGWSDEDIAAAFKKYPTCMAFSEDKLMAGMDFFVNELGLKSSVIANRPLLLGFSLKNRLIPRGEVIKLLSSKGLLILDSRIDSAFCCLETHFLDRYVDRHKEKIPHLINLYNDKLAEAIDEGRK